MAAFIADARTVSPWLSTASVEAMPATVSVPSGLVVTFSMLPKIRQILN
jgi:hypothetical protein